jgi:hypothetical protein
VTREDGVTEEDVWNEHVSNAKVAAHWAYLFVVLGGSLVLMLGLIALLGAR